MGSFFQCPMQRLAARALHPYRLNAPLCTRRFFVIRAQFCTMKNCSQMTNLACNPYQKSTLTGIGFVLSAPGAIVQRLFFQVARRCGALEK